MALFRRWGPSPQTAVSALAWSRVLAASLGAATAAGAAQLGIAYGFGLIRFTASTGTGALWSVQLTWVVWFAALAVLAGAAGGTWLARRRGLVVQLTGRVAIAVAAGTGAVVVAPLSALPARAVELANRSPELEAVLAAVLGVVIGVLATTAALALRPVAVNLIAVVAVVWSLALISLAPSVGPASDRPPVRLGVLDLPGFDDGVRTVAGVLSAPLIALLVGGAIAALYRMRALPPALVIPAAPAGAALLALSYLASGPGPSGDRASQLAPYAGSLIAIAAGLLAAGLVTLVRLPGASPDPAQAQLGPELAATPALTVPPVAPAEPIVPAEPVTGSGSVTADPPVPATDSGPPQPASAAGSWFDPISSPDPEPVPQPVSPAAPSTSARPTAKSSSSTSAPVAPEPARPTPVAPPPVAPEPVTPPPVAPEPETPPPAAPVPEQRKHGKKSRGRRGKAKQTPPPPTGAEADYLGWVKELGGDESSADKGSGRRRLRHGGDS